MNAQPVDRRWFISRDGKRYGPYSFEALTQAAAKGLIDPNTRIWRLGWVKWHAARSVPGLIAEPQVQPELDDIAFPPDDQEEVPRNLAPEDVPPLVEDAEPARKPEEVLRAVRQRQDFRPVSRRVEKQASTEASPQPVSDNPDDANAIAGTKRSEPPRLVADAPLVDRNIRKKTIVASPTPQQRPEKPRVPELPPQQRGTLVSRRPQPVRRTGQLFKGLAAGALVLMLVLAVGWSVYRGGLIRVVASRTPVASATADAQSTDRRPTSKAAGAGLPDIVATLPAVEALAVHDPAAFQRFVKRFTALAADAPEDQLLSLARVALRRSVRKLLANASEDTLLEITDTYLEYMKALAAANPESCVALSDEGKGAQLTVNFAKDYPVLFIRDMAVMERIASTDSAAAITPLTPEQAQPLLAKVFNVLRSQPVNADLLGRDKLTPAEYSPYCQLVIAFYEAVLAMPRDDKVNLLRYLYAVAAVDADNDTK